MILSRRRSRLPRKKGGMDSGRRCLAVDVKAVRDLHVGVACVALA
jgi:hypothetical protein